MAKLFKDEKGFPDNAVRKNFVFLAYPYEPALPKDDYRAVMKELEQELPLRLWYFLDEVTNHELMRKVWRAILRADLAFFDISRGNPNVAFEMGLAVAEEKACFTLLKTGEPNPLGGADLSYSERAEYQSRETLKAKMRELLSAKSSALRLLRDVSYHVESGAFPYPQPEIEARLRRAVCHLFRKKKATRADFAKEFGSDGLAGVVLDGLRQFDVIKVEGQRRAARWRLAESWVYHDHEVVGA